MQPHIKNYLESRGLDVGDVDQIVCEVCGVSTQDIHHITPKSLLGSDEAENLIALCRTEPNFCHDKADDLTKDFLYHIVKKRMGDKFRHGMEKK